MTTSRSWQIVLWDEWIGAPHGQVCAEYDTRGEAEDALAGYVETHGAARVGLREHLEHDLGCLDRSYVDRGGR